MLCPIGPCNCRALHISFIAKLCVIVVGTIRLDAQNDTTSTKLRTQHPFVQHYWMVVHTKDDAGDYAKTSDDQWWKWWQRRMECLGAHPCWSADTPCAAATGLCCALLPERFRQRRSGSLRSASDAWWQLPFLRFVGDASSSARGASTVSASKVYVAATFRHSTGAATSLHCARQCFTRLKHTAGASGE